MDVLRRRQLAFKLGFQFFLRLCSVYFYFVFTLMIPSRLLKTVAFVCPSMQCVRVCICLRSEYLYVYDLAVSIYAFTF